MTNRLTTPFARWLPGFGVVLHVGRRSGRRYRTPVNVFRTPRGYSFALTYGAEAEWVKNVLAAGGCELVTRGRRVQLTGPELRHDPGLRLVPAPVRLPLRLLDVTDFLELGADDLGSGGKGDAARVGLATPKARCSRPPRPEEETNGRFYGGVSRLGRQGGGATQVR